jgi:hypothetical protein
MFIDMNKQNAITFIEEAEEPLVTDDIKLMIKGLNPVEPVPIVILKKLMARILEKQKYLNQIEDSLRKSM